MNLKRIIFLIIALLSLCGGVQAQLFFDPAEWDFGRIEESDGRVSHTFTGFNRSGKPLVILDVVTSCGCTVPDFSQRPVLPGDTTRITVTFDPANRPGAFTKELDVYSSEKRKIASLVIHGNVSPREKTVEELYPVDAGGGLRLSETLCAFTYLYPGKRMQSSIGYAYTSDRSGRLELRPETASGLLRAEYPRELLPGERGEINLSYFIPTENPRYGTLRDALSVFVNGRSDGIAIVAHGIGVDNPADMEPNSAPKAQPSENIIKFGPVKHTAPIQRKTFLLSNTGRGPLIVRAVENRGRVAVALDPGRRIAPGEHCRVELLLDPSVQEYGPLTDHLILITNDPARPMRRLRITAIIED